jgi:hypothetical protein
MLHCQSEQIIQLDIQTECKTIFYILTWKGQAERDCKQRTRKTLSMP